jgi:anti-sigma B factor antagonist
MDIRENETTVEISLSGSLDLPNIKEFSETVDRLCANGSKNIELDLSEISYIDSTGMSLLLKLYKRQKQQGLQFIIAKVSDRVAELISLCSLSETLRQ